MTAASILADLGLLSWAATRFGFRRGWMNSKEVAARAVEELGRRDEIDQDVADLATAELLAPDEIDAALSRIISRAPSREDEAGSRRRWLLARLVVLERSALPAGDLLDQLEETYAEFGFPDELHRLSRYNVEPAGRDASVGAQLQSPIASLSEVIQLLERELITGGHEPKAPERRQRPLQGNHEPESSRQRNDG